MPKTRTKSGLHALPCLPLFEAGQSPVNHDRRSISSQLPVNHRRDCDFKRYSGPRFQDAWEAIHGTFTGMALPFRTMALHGEFPKISENNYIIVISLLYKLWYNPISTSNQLIKGKAYERWKTQLQNLLQA